MAAAGRRRLLGTAAARHTEAAQRTAPERRWMAALGMAEARGWR